MISKKPFIQPFFCYQCYLAAKAYQEIMYLKYKLSAPSLFEPLQAHNQQLINFGCALWRGCHEHKLNPSNPNSFSCGVQEELKQISINDQARETYQ